MFTAASANNGNFFLAGQHCVRLLFTAIKRPSNLIPKGHVCMSFSDSVAISMLLQYYKTRIQIQ